MAQKNVLAFDYGASSGRAIMGSFRGAKISLQEIHRFSNDPVVIGGTMYWDILRLFYEMKQGLLKAKLEGGFDSVGVDTWGVDFGLLDSRGKLIGNPVHYRDGRTAGMLAKTVSRIGKDRFYEITGTQFMEINTVFQLAALREQEPESLERADTMLLMPDLFNYFLTGVRRAEYSIASTTQLTDARRHCWSDEIVSGLGLPRKIFPKTEPGGRILAGISDAIRTELSLPAVSVASVCGHDTESALAGVPAAEEDFIFISCGTWSLMGTELPAPILSAEAEKRNLTNEGAFGGKTAFLKNIVGLWLIQESRRQWAREGKNYSFGELEGMAAAEKQFACFIDPDAPEFVSPGNIPERIRAFCRRTGQQIPGTDGQIVRCIDESLALKYRSSLMEISACTGRQYDRIYIVGGGTQSRLLCAMTADACGIPVSAGPVEATVYGNVALQLLAMGEIRDISECREIIRNTESLLQYEPADCMRWTEAFGTFSKVCTEGRGPERIKKEFN